MKNIEEIILCLFTFHFPISFAHLDLNQCFLRNWHSTDTFFLAMC